MKFETKFDFQQVVVLKNDLEKLKRIVTNVTFSPSSTPRYCLMQSTNESWHYEFEIEEAPGTTKQEAGFKIN